jgi:hypothetical protein
MRNIAISLLRLAGWTNIKRNWIGPDFGRADVAA